jgi:hypothetical protein
LSPNARPHMNRVNTALEKINDFFFMLLPFLPWII